MTRRFVCIICPNGCDLEADIENEKLVQVRGAACKRGTDYVQGELTNPQRTVATSVLVEGGELPLTSVRLDGPIPKHCIFTFMDQIKQVRLQAPVAIGQVVLENVCGSGHKAIVTKPVDRASTT